MNEIGSAVYKTLLDTVFYNERWLPIGSTIQVGSFVNSVFSPLANVSSPINLKVVSTCICVRKIILLVVRICIIKLFFYEFFYSFICFSHKVGRVFFLDLNMSRTSSCHFGVNCRLDHSAGILSQLDGKLKVFFNSI